MTNDIPTIQRQDADQLRLDMLTPPIQVRIGDVIQPVAIVSLFDKVSGKLLMLQPIAIPSDSEDNPVSVQIQQLVGEAVTAMNRAPQSIYVDNGKEFQGLEQFFSEAGFATKVMYHRSGLPRGRSNIEYIQRHLSKVLMQFPNYNVRYRPDQKDGQQFANIPTLSELAQALQKVVDKQKLSRR